MKISANLGFLYTDRMLADAIRAASLDGFDAVECHFPYATDPEEIRQALDETGLDMLSLNTTRGDASAGEFGLCALPGRVMDARNAIDQAIDYAKAIGASNVHVMAGKTNGGEDAETTFRENLTYACKQAAPHGIGILIEPINRRDVPGYHLCIVEHAAAIIEDINADNLKLMFDCYHTQIMQGDLLRRLETHLPIIGHIQIAAVPDRGEPNEGEVSYPEILRALAGMGYAAPIGAEYIPRDKTSAGNLDWLHQFQDI